MSVWTHLPKWIAGSAASSVGRIALTPHDAGIILDFPRHVDPRQIGRRRAWRTFEVGILTLIFTVIGYVALDMAHGLRWHIVLVAPFFFGLTCLVLAASRAVAARDLPGGEDDVRQLSVLGDLLIRTTPEERKQVWYRHEIQAISVDDAVLSVILQGGERAMLAGPPIASEELDWIAAELRQALHAGLPTDAIQIKETRIVEHPPAET